MSLPIRLGIAGFGRVAEGCYAPALRALEFFDVQVIAEPRSDARAAARRLFPNVTLALDAEEACAVMPVDAWIIALPPGRHHRAARAALGRGCHTFVEKPLTLDLAQAEDLVRVARASGSMTATGYVGRFAPAYAALRGRLRELAPGAVSSVHTQLTFDEVETVPWKETVAGGGGALNDIAVHHADLVRFLFDTEIVAVRARTRTERRADDTADVELRLGNAVHVQSFFSSARPSSDCVVVSGERIEWHAARCRPTSALRRRLRRLIGGRLVRWTSGHDTAFVSCLTEFGRSIQSGRRMRPDLEDGARGVAFLHAAHASLLTNDWVDLPACLAEDP